MTDVEFTANVIQERPQGPPEGTAHRTVRRQRGHDDAWAEHWLGEY